MANHPFEGDLPIWDNLPQPFAPMYLRDLFAAVVWSGEPNGFCYRVIQCRRVLLLIYYFSINYNVSMERFQYFMVEYSMYVWRRKILVLFVNFPR